MLSKETKVSVKNKENKTACFIEIEELLNSLELISDLPRLGIEDQEMGGELGEVSGERSPKAVGRSCYSLAWLQRLGLQKGAGCRFSVHKEGQAVDGNLAH